MAVEIKAVAAREVAGGVLGYLCWYTIAEVRITRDELERIWREIGLPEEAMPSPIRVVDAFKRACADVERKRIAMDGGRRLNLLVRAVLTEEDLVIRHLVREVVDEQNRRLEYRPVVAFELVRDRQYGDLFRRMPLVAEAELLPEEIEAAQECERLFQEYREHYTSRHIRGAVYDLLDLMDASPQRPSGGVYFLPYAHAETARRMQAMIRALGPFTATDWQPTCWLLPVLDTDESRAMVEAGLAEYVRERCDRIMADLAALAKGEKQMTKGHLEEALRQARNLMELAGRYEGLLERSLEAIRTRCAIVERQLIEVLAGGQQKVA